MIEYKQWHDEQNGTTTFHTQSKVFFCQCDAQGRLSLFELLRMVSDAAVEDFNLRSMSYKALKENGLAILVSRQSFRFHQMPKTDAMITIHTWEEKSLPLQFVRSYEITDTNTGEKLVSGISNWLLVNLNNRRIMKIKDFTMRPEPTLATEHDCLEPSKIVVPEDSKFLLERPIWYSDMDSNGHMNNARYGAYVIDCLPSDFQKKNFTDFRINYSKEAVAGQMLSLYGKFDLENRKITITGKQTDETCFEAELYYTE